MSSPLIVIVFAAGSAGSKRMELFCRMPSGAVQARVPAIGVIPWDAGSVLLFRSGRADSICPRHREV